MFRGGAERQARGGLPPVYPFREEFPIDVPRYDDHFPEIYTPQPQLPPPWENPSVKPRYFVGSVQPETDEKELTELFAKYGKVLDLYLNKSKNFAFVRMDSLESGTRAARELDGKLLHGRAIRIKRAPHHACVWVGKIPPTVSNDLLAEAFSSFGDVERAIVVCDEKARSKGWGFVEFARKPAAALAVRRCADEPLLLTASYQPLLVEAWDPIEMETGVEQKLLSTFPGLEASLSLPPRFAKPGDIEFEFAQRWKKLYEEEKRLKAELKKQISQKQADLEKEQTQAIELNMRRKREFEREFRDREDRIKRAMIAPDMGPHGVYDSFDPYGPPVGIGGLPPRGAGGPGGPGLHGLPAGPIMSPPGRGGPPSASRLPPDPRFDADPYFSMQEPPLGAADRGWRTTIPQAAPINEYERRREPAPPIAPPSRTAPAYPASSHPMPYPPSSAYARDRFFEGPY